MEEVNKLKMLVDNQLYYNDYMGYTVCPNYTSDSKILIL